MKIRSASPRDARALAHLKVVCWRDTYQGLMPQSALDGLDAEAEAPHWRNWLEDSRAGLVAFLAEDETENPVGYGLAGPMRLSQEGEKAGRIGDDIPAGHEIYALYVHPDHQRQGIGQALMASLVEQLVGEGARSLGLWMLAGNDKAEHFYSSLHAREAGKRVEIAHGRIAFREKGWIWTDLKALKARLTIRPLPRQT